MTKGIYSFYWDCGRNGDLEGKFIADSEDVKNIQGKYISFGEVLGKHSEIYGNIEEGDITLISDNPEVVEIFEKYDFSTGHNPFYHYDPEEEEDV